MLIYYEQLQARKSIGGDFQQTTDQIKTLNHSINFLISATQEETKIEDDYFRYSLGIVSHYLQKREGGE